MQDSQNKLMDKVIACCQEVRVLLFPLVAARLLTTQQLLDAGSGGSSQQLIGFLQEEMEKRGLKLPPETPSDGLVNGHSGG